MRLPRCTAPDPPSMQSPGPHPGAQISTWQRVSTLCPCSWYAGPPGSTSLSATPSQRHRLAPLNSENSDFSVTFCLNKSITEALHMAVKDWKHSHLTTEVG
ncbi:unnamed protein product [Rangifer tarandus platyrhynchus]|uniref:Uncharacterized protein n=2 Tax=Rangifer tarandus platyrhynchus TaxID=3082113 RepID=A0AC59YII0_RANTA|nr:unnamed protein product [Rangifer tarandus platyrhynchus]